VAAIGSMRERIPAVVTETTREITLVVVAARTEAMRGKIPVAVRKEVMKGIIAVIAAVRTEVMRGITLVTVAARTEAMRGKTLVVVAGTKMIDKKGIKSIYYEIS